MDSRANEITFITTLLFAAFFILEFLIFHIQGVTPIILSVLLLAVYLKAFLFRALSYEITDEALIVHRPLKNISFPRKNLNKVEIVDKSKMQCHSHSLRINGLFGYFGKFENHNLGNFILYATRKDKTVLIQTTDNKIIILTPDKPSRFIKELKNLGTF